MASKCRASWLYRFVYRFVHWLIYGPSGLEWLLEDRERILNELAEARAARPQETEGSTDADA